jgi:hypothetical protein
VSNYHLYNKNLHFDKAKNLLKLDDSFLRYACLELRFCIEAIVYQKVVCSKDLPQTIVETWQPRKVMKHLIQFNEFSNQDFKLEVSLVNSDTPNNEFFDLGEQKLLPVKLLTESYHKLGRYLHLTEPKKIAQVDDENIRNSLNSIVGKLEAVVKSNLFLSVKNSGVIKCKLCKEDIVFNKQNLKIKDKVSCFSDNCLAEYEVYETKDNGLSLSYRSLTAKCLNCGHQYECLPKFSKGSHRLGCPKCKVVHEITVEYIYKLADK